CQGEHRVPEKTSGADRSAPLRRLPRRESELLGLWLGRTVARGAEVEVQYLLVEDGLTVLERHHAGRVLRLRRRHLGLDARGLPGDLRPALCGHTRREVGAFGAIRAGAPGPDGRRLGEGHHRDDQRHRRQRYDSRPPHVTLRRFGFTAFDRAVPPRSACFVISRADPEIATRVPGPRKALERRSDADLGGRSDTRTRPSRPLLSENATDRCRSDRRLTSRNHCEPWWRALRWRSWPRCGTGSIATWSRSRARCACPTCRRSWC